MPQPTELGTLAAARVRMLFAERDIPIGKLETILGLSRKTVTRRIHGRYPFNSAELERIAEFLGVSVADLLGTDLDLRLTVAEVLGVKLSPPGDTLTASPQPNRKGSHHGT